MNSTKADYVLKAVIVGPSMAGKTSICNVLSKSSERTSATIGVGFSTISVPTPEGVVHLQLWDVGGHPTFRSATRSYLRGSVAVVCALDLASSLSAQEARDWLRLVKAENEGLPAPELLIFGNKTDLPRAVATSDLSAMAKDFGGLYAEGSAVHAPEGVRTTVTELVTRALARRAEFLACEASSLFARTDPYGDLNAPAWGRDIRARGCPLCACLCQLL